MTDAKRQQIKTKVAAGQARHRDMGRTTIVDRAGEAAIEAKDKFVAFAKEHPVATVAGGLALGILVSGLFKRSPTRRIGNAAARRAGSQPGSAVTPAPAAGTPRACGGRRAPRPAGSWSTGWRRGR